MAQLSSSNLRICSYNMYGFNNGSVIISDLCEQYDFVLLQEHWLTSEGLHKLDHVHKDFTHFSVSAMDGKVSSGVLSGRPFGGTPILCRSTLLRSEERRVGKECSSGCGE